MNSTFFWNIEQLVHVFNGQEFSSLQGMSKDYLQKQPVCSWKINKIP